MSLARVQSVFRRNTLHTLINFSSKTPSLATRDSRYDAGPPALDACVSRVPISVDVVVVLRRAGEHTAPPPLLSPLLLVVAIPGAALRNHGPARIGVARGDPRAGFYPRARPLGARPDAARPELAGAQEGEQGNTCACCVLCVWAAVAVRGGVSSKTLALTRRS